MAERHEFQKQITGTNLELKESEHKVSKFQKESRESANKVRPH